MSFWSLFSGTGAGEMNSLTSVCAIADEDSLRAQLERMPLGADSPFAAVPGTHFARLAVIAPDRFEETARLPPPLLRFNAVFRGSRERYLEGLSAAVPDAADAVWSHCDGYVDARADPAGFGRFLLDRAVPPVFRAAAYDAEPDEVRRSLELRRRLRGLAQDRAGMDDAALKSAFARLVGELDR